MDIQLLLYQPTKDFMLFIKEKTQVSIPSFKTSEFHIAEAKIINDYLLNEYQLQTNVVRCLDQRPDQRVYEVELLTPIFREDRHLVWAPPTCQENRTLLAQDQQWILDLWLTSQPSNIQWMQYGWRESVENWISQILMKTKLEITQIRNWEKCSLYQVETARDCYYIKAVPELFKHEPFVHRQLDSCTPRVFSIQDGPSMYIMKGLKGKLLGFSRQFNHWLETVSQMASVQKRYVTGDLLIQVEVPVRRFADMFGEQSLNRAMGLLKKEIPQNEYQLIHSSIPKVQALVRTLLRELPLSLDHGDLFGGNVIIEQDTPYIIDWSDSSITHPFLSMVQLFKEVRSFFSEAEAENLLCHYLDFWKEYGSISQLKQEFDAIQKLEPVFYLVVHILYIFPAFTENVEKKRIVNEYCAQWTTHIH
ncbi:phosphotransferase [Alkalicoccobacillus gibsonii]|uniref:phosphotransferase n=1 Tax=Alkalicoccobacillus gibsonii TaxID=79881 RepID=UPI001931FA09|nr:phosphotransferase [Alkalicoccobacillus gibsonii]MBM0066866.1 phosphotransferase [Alkalicoccobacillus gibsonii]